MKHFNKLVYAVLIFIGLFLFGFGIYLDGDFIYYIIIGILLVVVFSYLLRQSSKSSIKLKETGIRINAKYVGIEKDDFYDDDVAHAYNVICRGINPETGEEMTFKSHAIFENLEYVLDENTTIPVYYSSKNKYYVDIDEVLK